MFAYMTVALCVIASVPIALFCVGIETETIVKIERDCSKCNGLGEVFVPGDLWKRCSECNGTGTVTRTVTDES